MDGAPWAELNSTSRGSSCMEIMEIRVVQRQKKPWQMYIMIGKMGNILRIFSLYCVCRKTLLLGVLTAEFKIYLLLYVSICLPDRRKRPDKRKTTHFTIDMFF